MKTNILATAFAFLTLGTSSASAFTTGNHIAATDRALKRCGFDAEGIRHVDAANYAIDHMVNLPSEILTKDGNLQKAANVARYFHSDGLWLTAYVERELGFLDKALRTVVLDAKNRRDPKTILDALGIASHAVQDFYSHSNFADFDWYAWKGARIVTFEDLPRDVWENPFLTTRWHGGSDPKGLWSGMSTSKPYGGAQIPGFPTHKESWDICEGHSQVECGINHDGARRRSNLAAVLMASEATYDMVQRVQALVADSALWAQVQRPAADEGTRQSMWRAQVMSMAAGQWGWERPLNARALVIAFGSTSCQAVNAAASTAATVVTDPVACPVAAWDLRWRNTFFDMWLAAPTANARGGDAMPFPASGTQLFGVEYMPKDPAAATPWAGSYNVLWGQKRGSLVLTAGQGYVLAGTLTIDNRVYTQLRIRIRQGGLDIDAQAPDGARIDGLLYAVGPSKDLTGYLHDSITGIPDGFHGTRAAQNVAIKPGVFNGVKSK